jgi:hypothetical protein
MTCTKMSHFLDSPLVGCGVVAIDDVIRVLQDPMRMVAEEGVGANLIKRNHKDSSRQQLRTSQNLPNEVPLLLPLFSMSLCTFDESMGCSFGRISDGSQSTDQH